MRKHMAFRLTPSELSLSNEKWKKGTMRMFVIPEPARPLSLLRMCCLFMGSVRNPRGPGHGCQTRNRLRHSE